MLGLLAVRLWSSIEKYCSISEWHFLADRCGVVFLHPFLEVQQSRTLFPSYICKHTLRGKFGGVSGESYKRWELDKCLRSCQLRGLRTGTEGPCRVCWDLKQPSKSSVCILFTSLAERYIEGTPPNCPPPLLPLPLVAFFSFFLTMQVVFCYLFKECVPEEIMWPNWIISSFVPLGSRVCVWGWPPEGPFCSWGISLAFLWMERVSL